MLKFTTADRLKQLMDLRGLRQIDIVRLCEPYCKMHKVKMGRNALSQYVAGKVEPRQNALYILGQALNVSEAWLMGFDVPMERKPKKASSKFDNLPEPNPSEDYATFPVIGEVAAGYEHIAIENWEGDVVDIPLSYLRGRNKSDFFVLRVKGDSMYPQYQEGDKVLVLKQSTMDYSGQIGVVIYGDDKGTLKKVEYVQGEDWMRLIPVNPSFPPTEITNEDLEHCRVLGIPKLVIREVNQSKITKNNSVSTKKASRVYTSARFDDNEEHIAALGGIKEDDDTVYTT